MLQSRIAWLDHDAEARERSMRVLSMFGERDTRDELGLGSIRDNLADLLFPGTSTIQTRLRYMFFVPWVYQQVESELARVALESEQGRQGLRILNSGSWMCCWLRTIRLGCLGWGRGVP